MAIYSPRASAVANNPRGLYQGRNTTSALMRMAALYQYSSSSEASFPCLTLTLDEGSTDAPVKGESASRPKQSLSIWERCLYMMTCLP